MLNWFREFLMFIDCRFLILFLVLGPHALSNPYRLICMFFSCRRDWLLQFWDSLQFILLVPLLCSSYSRDTSIFCLKTSDKLNLLSFSTYLICDSYYFAQQAIEPILQSPTLPRISTQSRTTLMQIDSLKWSNYYLPLPTCSTAQPNGVRSYILWDVYEY